MKPRRARVIAWRVDTPPVAPPVGQPFFAAAEPLVEPPPAAGFDELHARNVRVRMWRGVRTRLGGRLPAPSPASIARLMREIEEASR